MAATEDGVWEPPLLSWKGMQLWSVGCRAPALCHMFMGLKAKMLPNLINSSSSQPKKSKAKRRKRRDGSDHGAGSTSLELPTRLSCPSSLDVVPVTVPQRHSISFESSSGRISNQLRRNSDVSASNLKRFSDHLRRNSDAASICNLQRLSTSSSPTCGGYERACALDGADGGRLDYILPREVKLGGRRSDVSVHLGRQDSGMAAHRRFSCSSFSSSSSVGSAGSATVKVSSRRSSASSETEQNHLNQLLVGNQFLTHLTAAPVATAKAHMCPSNGFLLDASVRCREAELKDRIIFFL